MLSDSVQANERLLQIENQVNSLRREAESSQEQLKAMMQRAIEVAGRARQARVEVENLSAEGLYLSLRDDLEWKNPASADSSLDELSILWNNLKAELQPVSADGVWLEKVRELEEGATEKPVLSSADREELESRLKETVCPICVCFSLDGTCTVEAFETCPITFYLDSVIEMVEKLGHRPWMEDYFEQMYRDICPGCKGRTDKNYCPPREEGECSLFSYLPTVARTIEDFMKEREERS